MSEYATAPDKGHDCTDLEKRTVRALTEYMTVLPRDGGIYSVTTESGSEYRVDAVEGRCTCPDQQYNLDDDESCKHVRRVAFATGDRPIPHWVNTDAVDSQLGHHVDSDPVVVASDGGTTVVEATDTKDDDTNDDGERPEDCDCVDWNGNTDLPCWPCYRDGFETPA